MGSQQNDIRKKITSRSTIVTWLLAPAILGGMALLGFQTYGLMTGKSFSEFNFEIGKLWSTEEITPVAIETNGPSNLASSILRELVAEPQDIRALEDVDIPQVIRKTLVLTNENAINEIVKSEKIKELFSSEAIIVNSISANFGNKQIQ